MIVHALKLLALSATPQCSQTSLLPSLTTCASARLLADWPLAAWMLTDDLLGHDAEAMQ